MEIFINLFIPMFAAFLIALFVAKPVIPALRRLKMGNTEREELKSHQKKSGTPSMGGIIFLIALIVVCLFYINRYLHIIPILITTVLFGIIGFIDDYLKAVKKSKDGLIAWQKFLLQFVVTSALGLYMYFLTDVDFSLYIPGVKTYFDIGFWAIPLFYLAVMGTVNGVNFTDGVDGLASSVTVVVAAFFTMASLKLSGDIEPACCALIGALMGFLVYNLYPAKVFMGDTGSLALGGFVAAAAYMMNMPIFIIIIGLVYLVEVISVILQVGYFKLTHGKRIFRMAPIHHHFELGGWSETKVVGVFSIVTVILCALAYTLL